jgi:hypothetical protein
MRALLIAALLGGATPAFAGLSSNCMGSGPGFAEGFVQGLADQGFKPVASFTAKTGASPVSVIVEAKPDGSFMLYFVHPETKGICVVTSGSDWKTGGPGRDT